MEQWVPQLERLRPLADEDDAQWLELLLAQRDLGALLATFADRAATVVRIHSLPFDGCQPHALISQHRQLLHSHRFELRGRHEHPLGLLQYELEHPMSGRQPAIRGMCRARTRRQTPTSMPARRPG